MSQGKRDTWGLKESSLVVFARFPQLSALEIPGWGHEVAYVRIIFSSENSTPSQLAILGNISYLEPTGRGRFLYRGCPLKDADRPRGASGGSLILDTWTLSSSLWLLSPLTLMPPTSPNTRSPPRSGLPAVGVCGGVCEHCIGE